MQELSDVVTVLKNENHSKKLYITLTDKAGESFEVKMGMKVANQLIKQLFRFVSPEWGGEREGAGKRKD
ncbi:MAG: hypothetical protein JWL82_295 [Parcubacteria group bacterium]|nr:hypothetical protein [Parcubacteria group bacterium]